MTDDIRDALDAFGERFDFGEYETTAYLTVLEHGEVTAADLAELTDIPQPRVYDTVRSLANQGLVELQETRPMRVLAVDPDEAFGKVQSSLDDLVSGLADRYTEPARRSEAVSLITSRSTISRHLKQVIENAEYELLLSLPPALLEQYIDVLRSGTDAGVQTDLLLSPASAVPGSGAEQYRDLADQIRVRQGVTTPIIAVADGFYALYATRQAMTDETDRYAVLFNRSELGFFVSGFFNSALWPSSESVYRRDGDRPFPRRYASIRRCIDDVRAHPDDLYARILGRRVDSGERCVVGGRIVDTPTSRGGEIATILVKTDDGEMTIGGQLEAAGDVEAHQIGVDRDEPPEL